MTPDTLRTSLLNNSVSIEYNTFQQVRSKVLINRGHCTDATSPRTNFRRARMATGDSAR